VQFSFGHSALEAQNEPVVEQTGMIDAIAVGDQRVSQRAQVK